VLLRLVQGAAARAVSQPNSLSQLPLLPLLPLLPPLLLLLCASHLSVVTSRSCTLLQSMRFRPNGDWSSAAGQQRVAAGLVVGLCREEKGSPAVSFKMLACVDHSECLLAEPVALEFGVLRQAIHAPCHMACTRYTVVHVPLVLSSISGAYSML
jgi:hypothetical protein